MAVTTVHGRQLRDGTVTSQKLDSLVDSGANWDLGGDGQDYDGSTYFTLVGVPNPSADYDVANKIYVDSVATGLDVKSSVRYATAALEVYTAVHAGDGVGATLTNDDTQVVFEIDGQNPDVGDRVLIKEQADVTTNGIYTVTTVGDGSTNWVLTRATDFDGSPENEVSGGAFAFVEEGDTNAEGGFVCTGDGVLVVDTASADDIPWSQFSGAGQIAAGTGLTKTGNTINAIGGNSITANANDLEVDVHASGALDSTFSATTQLGVLTDGTSIEISGNALQVVADGIDNTHIDWGSGGSKVDATDLPVDSGGSYAGSATTVQDAIEELEATAGATFSFKTVSSDAGDAVADQVADTLSILGGTGISTAVAGDTVTITNTLQDGGDLTASLGVERSGDDFRADVNAAGAIDNNFASAGELGVNTDGATIEINSNALRVKADGIDDTHIDWGATGAGKVNATDMPVDSDGSYSGSATTVQDALEELEAGIGTIDTLADGKIYLGDASGNAQEVTMSGDVTISNTGVTTIGADTVHDSMIDWGATGAGKVNATDVPVDSDGSYGGSATTLQDAIEELEQTAGATYSFKTVSSDAGDAVADQVADTLSILGGTGISTAVAGDTLTITNTLQDAGDLTASLGVERSGDDFRADVNAAGAIDNNFASAGELGVNVAAGAGGIEISSNALRISTGAAGNGLTGGGGSALAVQAVANSGIVVGASGIEVDMEDLYKRTILSDTTTPDGSEDEYPLPAITGGATPSEESNTECVYVNGVMQNPGAADDYTMAAGTGANSGKRVVKFNSGNEPISGDIVSMSWMVDLSTLD